MSKRIKLYLDEDAQRTDLIQALRARQVDVVTVSNANLLGQDDEVHLQYAAAQDRVIFTFNRGDFFRLHTGAKPLQYNFLLSFYVFGDMLCAAVLL